jgi:hypothetical protein
VVNNHPASTPIGDGLGGSHDGSSIIDDENEMREESYFRQREG